MRNTTCDSCGRCISNEEKIFLMKIVEISLNLEQRDINLRQPINKVTDILVMPARSAEMCAQCHNKIVSLFPSLTKGTHPL